LGGKALVVWELGNFWRLTNWQANLSASRTLNQPTGHSVSRSNFKTPHALAQSLGHLPPSLKLRRMNRLPDEKLVGGNKGIS